MTRDRSGELLRRYREASAVVDERPSDATRAAILAAAARNVGAKPEAAGTRRSSLRRRLPLAAAATVLLSSLAVILASRTEQQMPSNTMQQEPAAAAAPRAPLELSKESVITERGDPAEAAAAPVPPQAQGDAARHSRAVERPGGRSPEGDEPAARTMIGPAREAGVADAMSAHRPAPSPLPPAAPTSSAARPQALPAPAAPASSALESTAPAPRPTLPEAPSGAAKPNAAQPRSEAASRSQDPAGSTGAPSAEPMPRRGAPVPSAQGDDAHDGSTPKRAQRSAPEWLDLIVRLRTEGRHAEADVELRRFRETYPERELPAAAHAPAGVR